MSLADNLKNKGKLPCKQCGRLFIPRSAVNVFHNTQCRLDYSAGRTAAESLKREETGFAWDTIRPSPTTPISVPPANPISLMKGWKTAVVLPDQQFGYRMLLQHQNRLDPFHDPRAVHIAEQIVGHERPHLTVMLGDLNDLPTYGRFRQEPEFVGGVQAGLDRAAIHCNTVAELSGELRILAGNHDARIELHALDNALASSGLRKARRSPNEYPILSMPYLLGVNEMKNTHWVGGYPAGATYINENLAALHGRVTGKNLAEKIISRERVSTITGHVHRWFDEIQTFNHRGRPIYVRATSPGCLCRIDGHVPSRNSGRDPFGLPPTHYENWQQGVLVVRFLAGNGEFSYEPIPIFEGTAIHRGQKFISKKKVDDPENNLTQP